jgi:hypothetical protein
MLYILINFAIKFTFKYLEIIFLENSDKIDINPLPGQGRKEHFRALGINILRALKTFIFYGAKFLIKIFVN